MQFNEKERWWATGSTVSYPYKYLPSQPRDHTPYLVYKNQTRKRQFEEALAWGLTLARIIKISWPIQTVATNDKWVVTTVLPPQSFSLTMPPLQSLTYSAYFNQREEMEHNKSRWNNFSTNQTEFHQSELSYMKILVFLLYVARDTPSSLDNYSSSLKSRFTIRKHWANNAGDQTPVEHLKVLFTTEIEHPRYPNTNQNMSIKSSFTSKK